MAKRGLFRKFLLSTVLSLCFVSAVSLTDRWVASELKIDSVQTALTETIETKETVDSYDYAYKTLEIEKINDIEVVDCDTYSLDSINVTRVYFAQLTEDQENQLNDDESNNDPDVWAVILLTIASLAIVVGGVMLYWLLKKKDPNKMMSLSPFVVVLSNYADGPWIALCVLCGIAVVVWAVVLGAFLMKRKGKKEEKADYADEVKETEESVEEPETPEEEAMNVVDEEESIQIRSEKSFAAKLGQSNEQTKNYYDEIKNHALSYRGTNSNLSWGSDSIKVGKKSVMKFDIKGKTLCVYYAHDEVDDKYKVERAESKKYADVPVLYRIKNDRRCLYAKELVDILMRKLHIEKRKKESRRK